MLQCINVYRYQLPLMLSLINHTAPPVALRERLQKSSGRVPVNDFVLERGFGALALNGNASSVAPDAQRPKAATRRRDSRLPGRELIARLPG
jgi:hypothetical protein